MKKTFPLTAPGKQDARVVDSVKNEVRKYVKRESRKPVPEGADFWDFACKVGYGDVAPEVKRLPEVPKAVDAGVAAGASQVYVEIIAVPGKHPARPPATAFARPPTPPAAPEATPVA